MARATKEGKELVVQQCKQVKSMLDVAKSEISKVLPYGMTVERVIQVAYMTFSRTPTLLECSAMSVVRCVQAAAQLGLEIDGVSQDAHMVPYWNKDLGRKEAQFQVGYRGLVKLMKRHGGVLDVEARVVYKGDKFKCTYGIDGTLEHEPNWENEQTDENILGFYAIATFKDRKPLYEFMPKAKVDKIKQRTKSKDKDGKIYSSSPWITDYDEMGRKTVIKRLCKYLTTDDTLNKAIQWDHQSSMGERQVFDASQNVPAEDLDMDDAVAGEVVDAEGAEEIPPAQNSKAQQLADSIGADI